MAAASGRECVMKVGFGIFDARFAVSGWYFLLFADCEQAVAHDGTHDGAHTVNTREYGTWVYYPIQTEEDWFLLGKII